MLGPSLTSAFSVYTQKWEWTDVLIVLINHVYANEKLGRYWIVCFSYQSSVPEVSLIAVPMQSSFTTTHYLVVPHEGTQHQKRMNQSTKGFSWKLNFLKIVEMSQNRSPSLPLLEAAVTGRHWAVTQRKTGPGKRGPGAHLVCCFVSHCFLKCTPPSPATPVSSGFSTTSSTQQTIFEALLMIGGRDIAIVLILS